MKATINIECDYDDEFFSHLDIIKKQLKKVFKSNDVTTEVSDSNCYGIHRVQITERDGEPRNVKMRYITLREFIDKAETSKDIVILVKRDYLDGKGFRERCRCKSPVWDMDYLVEKKGGKTLVTFLKWEDKDGGCKIEGWGLDNEIKDILYYQGEYSISCYVEYK